MRSFSIVLVSMSLASLGGCSPADALSPAPAGDAAGSTDSSAAGLRSTTALTVTNLANGAAVSGTITISGRAGSKWVNVAAYANGAKVGADVTPTNRTYSLSVDTTQLANGAVTINVTAFSVAAGQPGGTSRTVNLTVNVSNQVASPPPPPPPPPPGPTPPGNPAPGNAVPAGSSAGDLDITSYGAVGDGTSDNQTSIQKTLDDAATKGVGVFVPAGTFAHSKTLTVNGVKLNGTGSSSVLLATDGNDEPVMLVGSGSVVANLKVTTSYNGPRLSAGWNTAVFISQASNFQVDHVYVDGSASAGILNFGGSHGLITNNTVINTKADAIHNTFQANFVTVDSNYIENAGDDGVAVVSYLGDGGYTHDITATNNVIINNASGRNMSVVGGENITYKNNYANGNTPGAACLYLAAEPPSSYDTYGAHNVTAANNTFENCGSNTMGHGALMIWGADQSNGNNDGLMVTNFLIKSQGQPGIVVSGSKNSNISLINYREEGQGSDNFGAAGQVIQNVPWTSGPVGYVPAPAGVSGAVPTVQ